MAVGEAFLSAFLQVLFDRLASPRLLSFFRERKLEDLVDKLKMTLLAITAVLGDADRQRFDSAAVERWLRMAKDAVYDAEDALDELATEALQGKLEAESPTSGKWSRISRSVPQPSTVVESNLRKIIEKLEYISHQKDVLGLKDGRFVGKRLATTSLVDESCVYGRDDDKEIMVGGLLSGEDGGGSSGIGLVPIVGMGGVGKTTLAQLVYSASRVVERFKLRVWVWVSDQFDVTRVTKSILQSVTFQTYSDLHDLNLLQVSLRDELTGKKFLLVLDDVWSKRNGDWDVLWNPLRAGARGSKVIVTTRDADVALSMATVRPHHLECLTYDHCWSLFKSEAFENKSIDEHPNLEAIGREIVSKCDGLPLAAKRLGVILRSRVEESEWKDILGRKLWDLPDNGRDILGTLRLSYDHLPLHLRQCLSYCSMFPKGYEFEEETLVRLWIAEGFVLQLRANKRPEDVGREYLKDLVSSSFFQESTHRRSRFVMHGIMRDFAQYVSGEMCFSLEDKLGVGDRHTIFEKARHSSYIRGKRDEITKFEAFRGVEFLRTFLPLDPHGEIGVSYLSNQVPRDLLSRLKYLRVLSFKGYRITELPDSVGNLKHLRYLDLSHTAISMLPASLCTLRNLETLLLLQCRALTQLPTDMGNLKNLQHLCISRTRLKQMPEHMWKLTNLQTLSNFMVGKSSGSGIQDLRDLSRLSGSLVISGLQNVVSFRDAINASLRDKPELDELVLQWSGIFCDQSDETIEEEIFEMPRNHKNMVKVVPSIREAMEAYEHTIDELEQCNSSIKSGNERVEMDVLEMLQPHRNIKNLVVKDYGGTRFPTWVADPSFSHIVVFKLSNCKKCKHLPPFGQLPALKELTIEGMDGIEVVGPKFYRDDHSSTMPFPSLELLKFENMLEWVEWLSSGIEDGDDFHHLKKLEILDCPELKKLPPHFPALEKMSIARCEELTAFPRLPVLNDNLVLEGGEFPCLLELSIRMCPNLRKLPNLFPSLAILEIDECQELETLPRLPSIHELELRKCDEGVLQNLVALTSLTYLKMCQVSKAECLLEGFFQQLTALEEIQIAYFGDLTTLSNEIGLENLPLLRRFEISGCPHLKRLPQTLHKLPL